MRARRFLTERPVLYFPIALLRYRRWLFFKGYGLLVDGYPRCANSYISEALRVCAPGLRVRSHCHNPAFVLYAVRSRKPVCLLYREPVAAISSWIVYSGASPHIAIQLYIDYYETIEHCLRDVVLVDFEEATRQFSIVVDRINRRYGALVPHLPERWRDEVHRRVSSRDWGNSPRQSSLPDASRQPAIEAVAKVLQTPKYREQVARAYRIYNLMRQCRS